MSESQESKESKELLRQEIVQELEKGMGTSQESQEARFGDGVTVYLDPRFNYLSYTMLHLNLKTGKTWYTYDRDAHMADTAYLHGVWEKSTANGGEFPPITTILKGMPSSN